MALVMAPFLLEDPRVYDMFPGDAIARARTYLEHVKGGIGGYSDSKGNPYIRQEVRGSGRWRCNWVTIRDVFHLGWPDSAVLLYSRQAAVYLVHIKRISRSPAG